MAATYGVVGRSNRPVVALAAVKENCASVDRVGVEAHPQSQSVCSSFGFTPA